jgi:hypothetical protein
MREHTAWNERRWFGVLTAFASAVLGGIGCADDASICTTEARHSVRVSVVHASGATVSDAAVSHSVDAGPMRPCTS